MRRRRGMLAVALSVLALGAGVRRGRPRQVSGAGGAARHDRPRRAARWRSQSYMPYTAVKGGKIVGLDGEILSRVADKLGLEVEPQLTDFNGMLGGVQSHRVDITIGGVAWTEERQKQGLFTDPPYYSPPAMGVRGGQDVRDRRGLRTSRLGTVTGYVWVKSIKAVPGAQARRVPERATACSTTSAPAASTSASSTRC